MDPRARVGPDPRRVHSRHDLSRELELLRARAARGTHKTKVSLTALAKRAGLPRSTLHAYLTGTHLAPVDILDRIVTELGATPAELREWAEAWLRVCADQKPRPRARTAPPLPAPIPRELPPAIAQFTGRESELDALTRLLTNPGQKPSAVVISAVAGAAGIGKTALAVHFGHHVAGQFPDGQLYVNLRGFDPSASPMTPTDAIRTLLAALQVPPERIPPSLDAQTGLYRSLTASRRLLVLLDNARDTEQIRPLLPSGSGCAVVVTSRNHLTGLITQHGAHHLPIDVLSHTEARALLATRLGAEPLTAEPDAVDELVACCGGFPLALSIVAGRAHTHPRLPLATLAAELREAGLDAWHDDDPTASLPTVLSWSYTALSREQATLFALVGIAPGLDIGLPAAASLIGETASRTQIKLRQLEHASLLSRDARGRYRMHDLVRRYATDYAARDLAEADRHAALRRVVDYYLHTAHTADHSLNPHRPPIQLNPPAPGARPLPLSDTSAAMAWFDAEHPNLLNALHTAITRAWHHITWQLAWTLTTFHLRRGHSHDKFAVWLAATHDAHLLDPTTVINAGDAEQALALAERHLDLNNQVYAHKTLSVAWARLGDDRQALDHASQALHLLRTVNQPVQEAQALNAVGWYAARLGDYNTAREHCQAALDLHQHHNNPSGEAITQDSLGYIAHHTGHHHQAIRHYQKALALYRDLGHTYQSADTLDRLGHPYAALGQRDHARTAWQQALDLYQTQQHRTEDTQRIQQQLDTLGASKEPPG